MQRGQNFWGLGDMVRGMLHSCQLAKKYDYSKFIIDVRHHPVSKVLRAHHHDYEDFVDDCIHPLEFTLSGQLETKIKTNSEQLRCVLTNGAFAGAKPSEDCLDEVRRTFTPFRNQNETYDVVVHIRMGDSEMIKNGVIMSKEKKIIEKLKSLPRTSAIKS